MISGFFGDNRWLSNFWPCDVAWGKTRSRSVEAAYQSAKCLRKEDRDLVAAMEPAAAKQAVKRMQQRPDWLDVRVRVMAMLLRQKFAIGTELANRLIATGVEELIEANTWGDTFWGVCRGHGQNVLGKLLMEIRSELVTAAAE